MPSSAPHFFPNCSSTAEGVPANHRHARLLHVVCLSAALLPDIMYAQSQRSTKVPAVVVPGALKIHVSNWTVPGPAAHPSGIFSAKRDGATWYATETTSAIGRFDGKTQKFEEFHLRPDTHPNAMVEHSGSGVQSTMYFTSRDGGYVGEFDPNTRDVREFRIAGGKLRLQKLAFDRNGVVWFTVGKAQPPEFPQGNKVGFINLFSSEIEFAKVPTPGADPFDLAADYKGTIFFTEFGSPRIGAVDPESLKVTEYSLPNPRIGTNSLTITPDDALWYTDSTRGYVGRFEPKTRKFQEWPSPSGAKSRPTAITGIKDVIWYVEAGTEPNVLVRFDSTNQKFQSWPLTEGEGVGQLYAQPDGALWLTRPQSNSISQILIEDTK
jgi:virginiamycin B lyase